MTQFKYSYFLLGCVIAGLWFAGEAYATQSAPTPGASVGHRPKVNSVIVTDSGLSLDSGANKFYAGSTIRLMVNVVDADGDETKAGAYCVWWRYPMGGGSGVIIQDLGPADRNCQYTPTMSDVKGRLLVEVTAFSDSDKAQAKGYTLNPDESTKTGFIASVEVLPPP